MKYPYLKHPSTTICTSQSVKIAYDNVKSFLLALNKIKRIYPNISDEDITITYDEDGVILLYVSSNKPNPYYDKELVEYNAKVKLAEDEYALELKEYQRIKEV